MGLEGLINSNITKFKGMRGGDFCNGGGMETLLQRAQHCCALATISSSSGQNCKMTLTIDDFEQGMKLLMGDQPTITKRIGADGEVVRESGVEGEGTNARGVNGEEEEPEDQYVHVNAQQGCQQPAAEMEVAAAAEARAAEEEEPEDQYMHV